MQLTRIILSLLLIMVSEASHANSNVTVEVFYRSSTDRAPTTSLPGTTIKAWDLDAPKRMKAQKPKISGTQQEVITKAQKWLNSKEGKAHLNRSFQSFEGFGQAMKYRLKKVPAIVLDGKQVVYGTTSIRKALIIYRGSK